MEKITHTPWRYALLALALVGVALMLPRHGHAPAATAAQTVPAELLASKAGPAPEASPLFVYVCGAVHKPGVYRLNPSARIVDALRKAGGATGDADLDQLNLAELASDGMKIAVPRKGQAVAALAAQFSSTAVAAGAPSRHRAGRGNGKHKLQPGQTLDVNTASEQELTTLPGVGPGLARRIIEYRAANGPFQSVEDLQNVSGIGPSKFEKMAPYVRL